MLWVLWWGAGEAWWRDKQCTLDEFPKELTSEGGYDLLGVSMVKVFRRREPHDQAQTWVGAWPIQEQQFVSAREESNYGQFNTPYPRFPRMQIWDMVFIFLWYFIEVPRTSMEMFSLSFCAPLELLLYVCIKSLLTLFCCCCSCISRHMFIFPSTLWATKRRRPRTHLYVSAVPWSVLAKLSLGINDSLHE